MFKKKAAPLAMDTVLGEYTSITGNIESEGSVKILGKVEGDIKASGDVYIETTSTINGNVYGSNVFVSGTIKGNILSKGLLHLMTQARVYGDIEIGSIVTDEGAIFQGNCRMIEVSDDNEKSSNNSNKNKKNKLKTKKKLED
ncbi:MAG: polymer-forming cytoskeletal protein [Clostridiaceae bacterium]|nr:polymer-forming cytoskeletal protein [Clostridiaceae bacterium]